MLSLKETAGSLRQAQGRLSTSHSDPLGSKYFGRNDKGGVGQ